MAKVQPLEQDIAPPEIDITSLTAEQQKHRGKNVGGSEIGCLFGCGYKSELELWLEKAGEIPSEKLEGEHIERGIFMEEGIARWCAYRTGWTLRKVHRYITHKTARGWGASLDYEIVNHPDGAGVLQVKSVSFFAGKRDWILETDAMEAPPHIELQLQHELGAVGRAWGAIGAEIGGSLKIITRQPNQRIQELIGEKVEKFWDSIERGIPPEPNPERDLTTMYRLFPECVPGKIIDRGGNEDFMSYVHDLEQARAYMKAGEALEEAAKCAILWNIKDAELVELGIIDGVPMMMTAKSGMRKGYVVEDTMTRTIRVKEKKPDKPKSKKESKDGPGTDQAAAE